MPLPSLLVATLTFAVVIGTVTDRTTGQPLPYVTIAAGAVHATTGPEGTYRLTGLKPGKTTLTASSNDVPPQPFPIVVGPSTTKANLVVCSVTLDYHCGGME